MKKIFSVISMVSMTIIGAWFFFVHTRIGVGFRVLYQMLIPPIGLFDNKVEIPVRADTIYYEILMTNRFVGCYAVRLKVPMEVCESGASPFKPPDILKIRYSWAGGTFEQSPCEKSWSSLDEGRRTYAYRSVLVPIEVPIDKEIKVEIEFPGKALDFFAEYPGCLLSFGKDSDE